MTHRPIVTIVTPVFNQEKYVSKTINSILNQTYENIEYIVINDGSTDGTKQVIEGYSQSKLILIDQVNSGQASSLNTGWRGSSGKYLAYLSGDDILLPEAVERSVSILEANENISVVYCDFGHINEKDERLRSVSKEEFDIDRLTKDLVCQPGVGAFFRRSHFDAAGGWREDLQQVPDLEFWLRLSRLGEFRRIPEVLALYRVHSESASVRAVSCKRADEIIHVAREHWSGSGIDARKAREALSAAYVTSARYHIHSKRFLTGVARYARAFAAAPSQSIRPEKIRSVLASFKNTLFPSKSDI